MDQYKSFNKQDFISDSDKSSTVSSIKSKNMKAYVGYEVEELKKTSFADLKQLKITVFKYLKSSSQKYKNSEYVLLYKRVINEINIRNGLEESSLAEKEEKEEEKDHKFLGRKKNFRESMFDILIPSFLNDKQIITNTEELKELKNIQKQEQLSSGESDSSFSHTKKNRKKSLIEIINKKCIIKGKLNN
jgi:hypothetical protein